MSVGLKDSDDEQHYQDLFEMYGSSRGWARVIEQYAQLFKGANNLIGIETAEQLHFRKGQLDIITLLLDHQNAHEQAYAALIAEQTGEEAEAATGGVAKVIASSQEAE